MTLLETVLAFGLGTVLGLVFGLWLALAPTASAILDPYIKAANSMPRVILAPIFGMWFGLGIWSKVALAVTLVFFIVFFNVYQGVKEVSPVVLANARMLGANQKQLLRTVYLPSATSWVFSSLHTSVGLAFVGAVVGEYLGSARGVGYLILQAEGTFDVNTVFAGIVVLTSFALVLDGLVGRIEKRLMKWQPRRAKPRSSDAGLSAKSAAARRSPRASSRLATRLFDRLDLALGDTDFARSPGTRRRIWRRYWRGPTLAGGVAHGQEENDLLARLESGRGAHVVPVGHLGRAELVALGDAGDGIVLAGLDGGAPGHDFRARGSTGRCRPHGWPRPPASWPCAAR